jgi:hypothetical protein
MKRIYDSGAKKRVKKKKQLLVTAEHPKINSYFAPVPSHQGI